MSSIEKELKEREKELDCLYDLSPLFTSYSGAEEPLLTRVVLELTNAMTSPDSINMKLHIENNNKITTNKKSPYVTARLNNDESLALYITFLNGEDILVTREKNLLHSVIELTATAVQRLRNEADIKTKNSTLTDLLTRLQKEREKDLETIQIKIRTFIFPLINQLKQIIPKKNELLLSLVESELESLTSSGRAFSTLLGVLTPREMEICSFVAKGIGSKDIASSLNISPETVERHRCTIRKKLKINGKTINLKTYLTNL